jgi:hypothetical protein
MQEKRVGLACAPPPPTNNTHTNDDVALVSDAHYFEVGATEQSNGANLPRRFTFRRMRDIKGKTSLIAGPKYFGFGGAAASSTAFGGGSTLLAPLCVHWSNIFRSEDSNKKNCDEQRE